MVYMVDSHLYGSLRYSLPPKAPCKKSCIPITPKFSGLEAETARPIPQFPKLKLAHPVLQIKVSGFKVQSLRAFRISIRLRMYKLEGPRS